MVRRQPPKPSSLLLYEQVMQQIITLIEQGSLKPGERLPSVRKLSKQLGMSIATIVQAYGLLESQGYIEARPQSGYYVSVEQTPLPEPERTQTSLAAQKVSIQDVVLIAAEVAGNDRIIQLGAATPAADLFPVTSLKRIMGAVSRQAESDGFFYQFLPGHEDLRRQIAKRSIQWGCRLSPEDLVITSGAMEAIHLSLRAVAQPGDTIAVESPTFYPILQMLEHLGMYALEIPTHPREGLDLNVFETLLKRHPVRACVFLPNFNNPLGFVMPDANKQALLRLLAKKGIPVIEDDIYGDMHYGPLRPKPLKAFDTEELVIHCSSFSKSLWPGARVGYVAPGQFKDPIKRLKYIISVSTPTLSQIAIAAYLKTGNFDRHLRRLRGQLAQQLPVFLDAIATYFPSGTKVTRPHGGFVLWVELPPHISAMQLHQQAIRHHISIAPGPMFSAKQEYQNCIRLSCGYPWTEDMQHAFQTLSRLMKQG